MRKKILTVACLVVMLSSQCAIDHTTGNVNGDLAPVVTGILQFKDGSPAEGCTVELREWAAIADISGSSSEIENIVVADKAGRFSFSTPEAGIYVIEASGRNAGALIDSVRIEDALSNIKLQPTILQPTGTICGNVSLENNDDRDNVYVLIFGMDRYVKVNADGSFLFSDLPVGHYALRFLTTVDNHISRDIDNIEVISAQTTTIDTIQLSYTGVPVPLRLTASYDTLSRNVNLLWAKCGSANVEGYFIYRRNVTLNSTFGEALNSTVLNDTSFIDTTGMQDLTYEYCIAAVGGTAITGQKSNKVSVRIASLFECDTVSEFLRGPAPGSFGHFILNTVYRDERLYFLHGSLNDYMLEVFDTSLNFLSRISLSKEHGYYSDFCIDNHNCLFFCLNETNNYRIYRQGAGTTVPSATSISLLTRNYHPDIDFNDSLLFIACDSTLLVYDYNDSMLIKKVFPGTIRLQNIHARSGRIIFADWVRLKLFITDYRGNVVWETNLPKNSFLYDIAYDAQMELVYYFSEKSGRRSHIACPINSREGILHAFNLNGVELASYSIGEVNDDLPVVINLTEKRTLFITLGGREGSNCLQSKIIKLKSPF